MRWHREWRRRRLQEVNNEMWGWGWGSEKPDYNAGDEGAEVEVEVNAGSGREGFGAVGFD